MILLCLIFFLIASLIWKMVPPLIMHLVDFPFTRAKIKPVDGTKESVMSVGG